MESCLSGKCCADPGATDDLQAAIDGTPAGETLTLCAGAWSLSATVSIDNAGKLTLSDVTVSDNHATGDAGGGIANTGSLTLAAGALVTDNSADAGGGISNGDPKTGSAATATLEDGSRVIDNTAANDGGGIIN